MNAAALLFLVFAAATGEIHFPVLPVPSPAPSPPGEPQQLPEGVFYVITSDAGSFLVMPSPAGLVSLMKAQGPATLLGRFVEEPDKVQLKKIDAKNFAVITAASTGICELLVLPAGATSETQLMRRLIAVNLGPRPPPIPPVPPVPPPSPAPIPADGLHVLVVYETSDLSKLPAPQQQILYSTTIRAYLDSKCPLGPDGKTREWRVWDKDVSTTNESKIWQDAMRRPRQSIPWVIVSNPQKGGGFEGPLPANVDDALILIKKFGD